MVDLKDLFQVIFNMRKKEADAVQKVTSPGSGTFELRLIFQMSGSGNLLTENYIWGVKSIHSVCTP